MANLLAEYRTPGSAEMAEAIKPLAPQHQSIIMGNHGVIVVGPSVAQAFDELYYLEKACALQVAALATGRELALIPESVAAVACSQWNDYPTRFSELHLQAVKNILDHEASDYAL